MFVKEFDILRLWPIDADKQDNQIKDIAIGR